MKEIVIFFTLLIFVVKSFSQTTTLSRDYYLKKSKTQKTVAWVLLGGGGAATIIGLAVGTSNVFENIANDSHKGEALIYTGIAMMGASIPFFISSAKNARKSATISINKQKLLFPQQNNFVLKTQQALTLKIKL